MKIIINGAEGRMGKALSEMIKKSEEHETAAFVDRTLKTAPEKKLYSALSEFSGEADVIVDFSNHAATPELTAYAVLHNLPLVVATTGQTDAENKMIKEASEHIPIFLSYNMSLGIAFLADIAKRAAKMFPNAEIEIIETHHDQKLDVPSGTALLLAEEIKKERKASALVVGRHEQGKRTKDEIGIHSVRIGNVVGIHEVIISTGTQTLTLKHEAHDRALFAEGALAAAGFIRGKIPGIYDMKDITRGD